MDPPEDLPSPIAIQFFYDEDPKSKLCATTTNQPTNTNENIALFNKITSPSTKKIYHSNTNFQPSYVTNTKNVNVDIDTDHAIRAENDKITV